MANESLAKSAIRGFTGGVLVDTFTWMLTAFIPALSKSSPFKVPGYAATGMHWDDVIAIVPGVAVTISGAVERDANVVVEGVSMVTGSFVLSRFQACSAQKPW